MKRMYKICIGVSILLILIVIFCSIVFRSDAYNIKKATEYFKHGKYEKSLKYIHKVKQELDIDLLTIKEKSEMKVDKFSEALETLGELEMKLHKSKFTGEERDTKFVSLYYDQAISNYKLGQYEKALDISKLFFAIPKDKIFDQLMEPYIINYYFSLKRLDDCIEAVKGYLVKYDKEKDKTVILSHKNSLLQCYILKKQFDAALAINEELLKEDNLNLQWHLDRAEIYDGLYGKRKAKEYLESIQDTFKNNEKLALFIIHYTE